VILVALTLLAALWAEPWSKCRVPRQSVKWWV